MLDNLETPKLSQDGDEPTMEELTAFHGAQLQHAARTVTAGYELLEQDFEKMDPKILDRFDVHWKTSVLFVACAARDILSAVWGRQEDGQLGPAAAVPQVLTQIAEVLNEITRQPNREGLTAEDAAGGQLSRIEAYLGNLFMLMNKAMGAGGPSGIVKP